MRASARGCRVSVRCLDAGRIRVTRHIGRISGWQDQRGFGFVSPLEGGERVFIHFKAFQRGMRRPQEGDLISYRCEADVRGRARAVEARFAGQRPPPRRVRRRPLPRYWIAASVLLLVLAGALLGRVPQLVAGAYVLASLASYALYGYDKSAAGRGASRTPETTLHLLDVLGGWPGALVAQQQFRHKTVKASFQGVFWGTVVANLVAVAWLLSDARFDGLLAIRFWG